MASRLTLLAQALSINTRLRVRPFNHGIKPRAPGPVRRCGVSQVPHVELVDEIFLIRASSRRAKPLDVIFVAQRSLRAFLDPYRRGSPLRPELAARQYGYRGGGGTLHQYGIDDRGFGS